MSSSTARAGVGRSADASERLGGLDDVVKLLWSDSEPLGRLTGKPAAGSADLIILPRAAEPRLVVPAAYPRAAANAALRHGDASTVRARLQRHGLAWALRAKLGRRMFPTGVRVSGSGGPSVVEHLATLLNQPIVIAFALTPRRATRKPVLHVLDPRGRTLAFVKIGVNPLTRRLVRREAANLDRLARASLTTMRIPEVIHSGTWNDLELLVLSPLPTWRGRSSTARILPDSMRELSAALPDGPGDAVRAGYARQLVERAREIEARISGEDRAALAELCDIGEALDADPVTAELALGTWHGDWTPWNCRRLGNQLLVWDWERCATGVPIGFDALHFALNQAVVGAHLPHRQAAQECLARAPDRLKPWGTDPESAKAVAALYLLELGLRYVADQQRTEGGFGGDVAAWIIPALQAHLADRHLGGGPTE